jgi:hypothetical protein
MYTIFSAARRQQRKSDVMTSFGHNANWWTWCGVSLKSLSELSMLF